MPTLPDHLFVSSCDGALHDTRIADWHKLPPLRANYMYTRARIRSAADLKATLRAGAYAWPGGYPLYFLTSDGGALSFATVRDNLARVLDSIATGTNDGWRVVACEINWENADLMDDHTGEPIEAAYGD